MSKDAPAAKHKSAPLPGALAPKPGNSTPGTLPTHAEMPPPSAQLAQIRDLMWRHVGILRNGKELAAALESFKKMELRDGAPAQETAQKHLSASSVGGAHSRTASTTVATSGRREPSTRADHEVVNLHTLATLITRSALAREESRGSHYRSDYPYRDDDFAKHSVVRKATEVTFEP